MIIISPNCSVRIYHTIQRFRTVSVPTLVTLLNGLNTSEIVLRRSTSVRLFEGQPTARLGSVQLIITQASMFSGEETA